MNTTVVHHESTPMLRMQYCGNPGVPGSCSAVCGLILVEFPVSFHKKLDSLSF